MANDEGSPQVGVRQRRTRGTAAAEEASSSNRSPSTSSSTNSSNPRQNENNGDEGAAGGNDRDLSPEEVEKLVQMQDVTGIDDLQICRALLESKDWDLEATVMEHMGIPRETVRERAPPPQRNPDPLPEVPNARSALQARRPNRVHRNQGWATYAFDWGFYLLLLPVTVPYRIASTTFTGCYNIVAYFFGLPALPGGLAGRRPPIGRTDPIGDVRSFKEKFESKYGSTHPTFHPGSYSQVLDEAKKELKFLLVYLHSADHQDADAFCSSTLASPAFADFVGNNALFWGCSVDSPEGYRVSQALRESTYPFLAVIVLRQNRMMVVGRVEGSVAAGPLVERLEALIRDNEAFIVAARHEREERSMNQFIREEQDRAFQETLRQDQEKERKKKEEEDQKKREEEEALRLEKEETDRKEEIKRMKVELVSQIPNEPEAGEADCVRVLVKLPGGQRLERRFRQSHSLKHLYFYVFCHPESPDNFDVTTNFPRTVLRCRPEQDPATFEEAGLGSSVMLFVNDLDA